MKIALVISSLGRGGAERVLSTMANWWVSCGQAVTLVTLDTRCEGEWPLDARVERIALDLLQPASSLSDSVVKTLRRVKRLREALLDSGAGVVISFVDRTNVLTLMACRDSSLPVIVSERSNPRTHHAGKATNLLRRVLYRRARWIVVQTKAVFQWAEPQFGAAKIATVPNPVARPVLMPALDGRDNVVLGIGRLGKEKGFDLLIRAFALCGEASRGWRLAILGDGRERRDLLELASSLGVADRVSLPGEVMAVSHELERASIFALPSRYEGFPNAMLEAMVSGAAIVAFDCPHGPREILCDGESGLLVSAEDAPAMARALERLMGSPELRRELATAAFGASERFEVGTVMRRWDEIVADATRARG